MVTGESMGEGVGGWKVACSERIDLLMKAKMLKVSCRVLAFPRLYGYLCAGGMRRVGGGGGTRVTRRGRMRA